MLFMKMRSDIQAPRYCVIMPTYENAGTVCAVVDSVLEAGYHLIVVSDGPHDGTAELLEEYGDRITLVAYPVNKGKGHALAAGFSKALEEGYDYAVTIDSDGQHDVSDIGRLQAVLPTVLPISGLPYTRYGLCRTRRAVSGVIRLAVMAG